MPKVSILIPNYNHEKYLHERINSVLKQEFNDFEVIILDDASTDNSLAVIDSFRENKQIVSVNRNLTNSGSPFYQWENGISKARGEYIWIAESDDVAEPRFLSELVKILDNQPEVGLAYTTSKWIDETGKEIHRPDYESGNRLRSSELLYKDEFLKGPVIYNASSALFRKKLTEQVDFEQIRTYKYTGDWLFWVQLTNRTSVYRLDERLNLYRRHLQNVSFKADKGGLLFIEGMQVINYIYKNHSVVFLTKQLNSLRWAKKLINSEVDDKAKVLQLLPKSVRFYYNLIRKFI